jgi:hypothetical protein
MNLRNFQTQLNHSAVLVQDSIGDRDPEVVVMLPDGTELPVERFTDSFDGKVLVHVRTT